MKCKGRAHVLNEALPASIWHQPSWPPYRPVRDGLWASPENFKSATPATKFGPMDTDKTDHPAPPAQGAARLHRPICRRRSCPPPTSTPRPRPRGGRRGTAAGTGRGQPPKPVAEGPLAVGHAAIENAVKLAPTAPGVYRMMNAASDVLYVGKAERPEAARRPTRASTRRMPARIVRMIAATANGVRLDPTETEALLLEANLIKRLRPRFNVLLRDDKSFPYILHHRRPPGAADLQASRRARRQGRLFRPVRLGRRGQPHHQFAAARLPAPHLHRQRLREPHAAVPALPDQALLRPVHRRDRSSPAMPSWCARRRTFSPAAARA